MPVGFLGDYMSDILPFEEIKKISFTKRPVSIGADMRPLYKISEILLIIKYTGWGEKASLLKIQFINWLLNNTEELNKIISLTKRDEKHIFSFMHMDPIVNLALDYAIGSELLEINANSLFQLTSKGEKYFNYIENEDVFKTEKEKLKNIGKKISESFINKLEM